MIECEKRLTDQITQNCTWGDVAAICFAVLKEGLPSEEKFIGEFFEEGLSDQTTNPNLGYLNGLMNDIRCIAGDEMSRRTSRSDAITKLKRAITGMCLIPFGEDAINQLTPCWAIIKGIDLAYGNSGNFASIKRRGPINALLRDEVGVYLAALPSIMSVAIHGAGLGRLPEFGFNNQLRYMHFHSKVEGRSLPSIWMTVPDEKETLETGLEVDSQGQNRTIVSKTAGLIWDRHAMNMSGFSTNIRVGLVPFSCLKVAGLESDASIQEWSISYNRPRGKALTAVYGESYVSRFAPMVRKAMNVCMEQGCHIVLFPEAVVSSGLRETICDCLESWEGALRPALVVAGSGWEMAGEFGNNVSFLYDGYGHELGRYYKYSPYGAFESDGGLAFVEGLDNPGKECSIIDVKGIGRVLPSICKDLASNTRYTLDLAESFQPNIVCVPALSPSMDTAFSGPVRLIAERSLAVSVVCNQCGHLIRRKETEATIAMTAGPLQHGLGGHRTRCLPLAIKRTSECMQDCYSSCSVDTVTTCVRVIDIDCAAFAKEGYISQRSYPLL